MEGNSHLSSSVESIVKRKPISELRLQDPELWDKVSWIRAHFVEDLDSGIRKMDFCNFVTEHLGRTGYRDVWHLLKIAYPHVDRVRKGRKYMYWGIRHADISEKDSNPESNETTECNNNDCQVRRKASPLNDNTEEDEARFERSPSIVVKTEKVSDSEDTTKPDNFLVIEFKEKDVFESFEDYEKSKDRINVERSQTPPLAIFSENQMENRCKSPPCKEPDKQEDVYSSEAKEQNEMLTTNLLKPENINRVCIPLIQDVKKRCTKNKDDDDSVHVSRAANKSSLDPVIVSVASIGGMNLQTSQSITQQDASSDIQYVVVQDRGIQVCETASNAIQRRKKGASQAKSTECKSLAAGTPTTVYATRQHTENGSRKRTKLSVSHASSGVGRTANKRQADSTNMIKAPTVSALPLRSRGHAVEVTSSLGVNGKSAVVVNPPAKGSNAPTSPIISSPYVSPSLLTGQIDRTPDVALKRARYDPGLVNYPNNNGNIESQVKTREVQNHGSRINSSVVRPEAERSDYDQFKNRELVRKLLEEHESQRNSKSHSSKTDLQYTVDCLSLELEKERSLRLRLEIELRKVENQLDQERKLNERLAALLMKR